MIGREIMNELNLNFGRLVRYRYLDQFLIFFVLLVFGALLIISASCAEYNQKPVVVSLTPNLISPQGAGTSIIWSAQATDADLDPIYYRFWLNGPGTGMVWKMQRNWSTDNTWIWNTTSKDVGNSELAVSVRDGHHASVIGFDSQQLTNFRIGARLVLNQPPLANLLRPSANSPQSAGTAVVWTAEATDAELDTLYYRFLLKGPSTGDSWQVQRDWSTDNSWTWNTSIADLGNSQIAFWVRDGSHADDENFDGQEAMDYQVTAPSASNHPPAALTLTSSLESPREAGASIQWTAASSDPESDTIFYRFWLKGPSTGDNWQLKRDWDTDNSWTWETSGSDVGSNQVAIWVRDGHHADEEGFDGALSVDFQMIAPSASNLPPVAVKLTPGVASPQEGGTSVEWTGSATDADSDSIYYRFWLKGPSTGGIWEVTRDWSTENTWTWETSSSDVGSSQVAFWVRDGHHADLNNYDSQQVTTFQIIEPPAANRPPVAVKLTSDLGSPRDAGTPIQWRATARDSDSDSIYYRFWLKGPSTGGIWEVTRDWSTENTWTWETSSSDVGSSQVAFWVRDGHHADLNNYDSQQVTTFQIIEPPAANRPPTADSLEPTTASPRGAGTKIVWTATASDSESDTILYRFWLKGPATGEEWMLQRDWSTENRWTWETSSSDVGSNQVAFWVRDGHHADEDNFDSQLAEDFKIEPPMLANQPPVVSFFYPDSRSPQVAGTWVKWTVRAEDPDRDQLYYKFWLKGPSTHGVWVDQTGGWTKSNSWIWRTTSADAGSSQVVVYVRDGKHAATGGYDAYGYRTFEIVGPNEPPRMTGLKLSVASPQSAGSTVTWTASATDAEGDALHYRFWLRGPATNDRWRLVQDWSTSSVWSWKTAASDVGESQVVAHVRDGYHAGPDSWDDDVGAYFTVSGKAVSPNQPPTLAGLSPDRASPQSAGGTVRWTAQAADPDGDQMLYRFWLKGPSTGNSWKIVQDWSSSKTWTWSSAPRDDGQYLVFVFVRDGKHATPGSYDAATGRAYRLVSPVVSGQLTDGPFMKDIPRLISTEDGFALAYQSWEKGPSGQGDVYLQTYDRLWNGLKGTWVASDISYQDSPSLIYSSDGYYYVAYVSRETGNLDIFVKKFDQDLTLVDTRQLTTSPADQDSPSLQMLGDEFYLAYQSWESGPGNGGDIFVTRFDDTWRPISTVQVTRDRSYQDRPSLITAGGRLYLAFVSEETGNLDIFVQEMDPGLILLDKKQITSDSSSQDMPYLAWINGEFVLLYSSNQAGDLDIYMERFYRDWKPIDNQALMPSAGLQMWPSVAYSRSDGLYWVSFVSSDGSGRNIYALPVKLASPLQPCQALMSISATRSNQPYTLDVRFYNNYGELADPSSLGLSWSPADAATTGSTLNKVSTGRYQLRSRFGAAGDKTFKLTATIDGCYCDSTLKAKVT